MNKTRFTYLILISFTYLFMGCNENINTVVKTDPEIEIDSTVTNYTSNFPTNLNVVYFIPSDKDTLENYQKRISGIILHTQAWFKKEMDRNGFGEKTFGLLIDDKDAQSIKITIIHGKKMLIIILMKEEEIKQVKKLKHILMSILLKAEVLIR